jgi:hypothetical protein
MPDWLMSSSRFFGLKVTSNCISLLGSTLPDMGAIVKCLPRVASSQLNVMPMSPLFSKVNFLAFCESMTTLPKGSESVSRATSTP